MKKYIAAYNAGGQQAVYTLADKNGLKYSHCAPCETDTPTYKKLCAVCSQNKTK